MVCPDGYENIGGRCVHEEFTKKTADGKFELDATWLDSTIYSDWTAQRFVENPATATARIPHRVIPPDTGPDNDTIPDTGVGGLATGDDDEEDEDSEPVEDTGAGGLTDGEDYEEEEEFVGSEEEESDTEQDRELSEDTGTGDEAGNPAEDMYIGGDFSTEPDDGDGSDTGPDTGPDTGTDTGTGGGGKYKPATPTPMDKWDKKQAEKDRNLRDNTSKYKNNPDYYGSEDYPNPGPDWIPPDEGTWKRDDGRWYWDYGYGTPDNNPWNQTGDDDDAYDYNGESYYYYDDDGVRKEWTTGFDGTDAPHTGDGEFVVNPKGELEWQDDNFFDWVQAPDDDGGGDWTDGLDRYEYTSDADVDDDPDDPALNWGDSVPNPIDSGKSNPWYDPFGLFDNSHASNPSSGPASGPSDAVGGLGADSHN